MGPPAQLLLADVTDASPSDAKHHITNKSTQAVQTSANAKIRSGIRIRISGLIRIRTSAGSLPKCFKFIMVTSFILPSFCKNRAVTMRNANKSPKKPYSAMVRKME